MEWEGPYRIQCPKCKGRDIFVEEHCDAFCQHRVINGVWHNEYNANDYGDYTFTEYVCQDCGHSWHFKGTMDKYLKNDKPKKKQVKNKKLDEIKKEIKKFNDDVLTLSEEIKKICQTYTKENTVATDKLNN